RWPFCLRARLPRVLLLDLPLIARGDMFWCLIQPALNREHHLRRSGMIPDLRLTSPTVLDSPQLAGTPIVGAPQATRRYIRYSAKHDQLADPGPWWCSGRRAAGRHPWRWTAWLSSGQPAELRRSP